MEVLPPTATGQDAGLNEGHFYGASLQPGVQLFWKPTSLSWLANPTASNLCGTHVCGDAILALEGHFGSEQQLRSALCDILAKAASPGNRSSLIPQRNLQGGSGAHRLAQQPGRACPAAQIPNLESSSSSSTSLATLFPVSTPAASTSVEEASAEELESLQASCIDKFEPRQQLLWAIASRATSISWSPSPTAPQQPPFGPALAGGVAACEAAGEAKEGIAAAADVSGDTTGRAGGASNSAATASIGSCSVSSTSGCSAPSHPGNSCEASCAAMGGAGSPERDARSQCGGGGCCAGDKPHTCGWGPWAGARPELLTLVVAQAGHSASFALLVSQVCSNWRQVVRQERQLLRELQFAARAGSMSAALVGARYLERLCSPLPTTEAWLWAKAAKKGHPEAQAKLGLAYYKGCLDLPCDCEEAALWLSRSAKQLVEHLAVLGLDAGPGGLGVSPPKQGVLYRRGEMGRDLALQLPLLTSLETCSVCLAQVAHILGLLHLDGEGTKKDLLASVKWLKVAEQHGCMEAGKVLGSLYNTGQFG
ncbi:hypothetical protein N2152v2_009554 [Parachlorella kessleri]